MSDLISRQAALDALDELAVERLSGQAECQAYIDALLDVAEKIRELKAAQETEDDRPGEDPRA